MKSVRTAIYNIITITLLLIPAASQSATLQLFNSSFDEMVAYFSSLTGNTYIQEYQSAQRFSITREDLKTVPQIQGLFEELVAQAGGQVEQLGDKKYKITEQSVIPKPVSKPPVSKPVLAKIFLENKISFAGLKGLIAADERIANLKIIEEISKENAVLILGIPSDLNVLSEFISNLPVVAVDIPQVMTSGEPKPSVEVVASETEENVTTVIDLNYADSTEIVSNLQPILSGQNLNVSIAPHASANQIIVSGPETSVDDALQLIQKLDRTP